MKQLVPMFKKIPYEKIISLDIETSSIGKILDIGIYDGEKFQYFSTWKKFFDHLLTLSRENTRVIAHNGFGFDYITFQQWLLKNKKYYEISDDDLTYLSSESLMVGLIIHKENYQYTFIDTMRYFPAQSLQKLAEAFLKSSKEDVPGEYISKMEDYKRRYRKDYYRYLRRDCELLYNIYIKFRDEINAFTDIGELGLSAGSTSLRSFRRWLHSDYPKTRIFSSQKEYAGFADYAMRGGLTLYIGDGDHNHNKYENVNHYDVISMYPSVMRYIPVPSSPMIYTKQVIKDFDCYRPGWYLCKYEQLQGRVPILFNYNGDYPEWSGVGVLSHFDLQFLDLFGKYEIRDGVVFDDYIFPFDEYLNQLLEIRLQAKRENLDAKAHALKILANSLYGKFSQKSVREIISITSDKDWYDELLQAQLRDYDDSGITEYSITRDYIIYGVDSQSTTFSNRFIGAMVTSLARIKLGCILNTVESIYCDTDSIFTQQILDKSFTGLSAGDFEKSEDSPNTMICVGKKSYLYGNEIKFKGVPNKNVTQEDIEAIAYGFQISFDYKSSTPWKTALKKNIENPNQFLPKTRNARRGKSLAEMGLLRSNSKLLPVNLVKEFLEGLLSL